MQYQIIYGNDRLEAQSEAERDAYVNVLKDLDVDYTVEESYLVAVVHFQNDSREYTYLTDKVYSSGSLAVVNTTEWAFGKELPCLKVVEILRCTRRTKADLESVCPFARYKHLTGEVYTFHLD